MLGKSRWLKVIVFSLNSNVKIYLSTTQKMPSPENCDQEYNKTRFIKVWASGSEKTFSGRYSV